MRNFAKVRLLEEGTCEMYRSVGQFAHFLSLFAVVRQSRSFGASGSLSLNYNRKLHANSGILGTKIVQCPHAFSRSRQQKKKMQKIASDVCEKRKGWANGV